MAPIKVGVGRQRPDRSNRLSFPSGHTANSFAMARILHRCYGRRIGIPLYALSAVVAAGRIEGDRHYLSDVVMGAFLGLVVGDSVTPRADPRSPHLSDSPLPHRGVFIIRDQPGNAPGDEVSPRPGLAPNA